jgi:hypothetical protein
MLNLTLMLRSAQTHDYAPTRYKKDTAAKLIKNQEPNVANNHRAEQYWA